MTDTIYNALPRTRAEALDLGSKQYFTGKQCLRHHTAPRWVSSAACVECTENDQKKYALLRKNKAV